MRGESEQQLGFSLVRPDTRDFVHAVRHLSITPHVAPRNQMRSGPRIDARTTRHPGFQVSQRVRKRIEEIFGWIKTIGGLRKSRYRGTAKKSTNRKVPAQRTFQSARA
jgi:hypothetical protein